MPPALELPSREEIVEELLRIASFPWTEEDLLAYHWIADTSLGG